MGYLVIQKGKKIHSLEIPTLSWKVLEIHTTCFKGIPDHNPKGYDFKNNSTVISPLYLLSLKYVAEMFYVHNS